MLWERVLRRKHLKRDLLVRKDKISMKNRPLKIDRKPRSDTTPTRNQILFAIDRKSKTKLSCILRNQIRDRKKQKSGSSKQVVGGVETGDKISGLPKKDSLYKRLLKGKPKRKLSCLLRNQIRDRKKRKMAKVNGVDGGVEIIDQISELPEPIIHHILSFVRCPKDVARTVALSKKWRMIWASYFTIDFDQRKFGAQGQGGEKNDKFINFVENSLATRLEPMLGIQKFRLYMTSFSSKLVPHLNHWLSAAINKNVKELEIHVEEKKSRRYILPENVLTAKMITSLKLYGCKLDNFGVIDLPCLKELSIKKANLNVVIIQSFIRSCPFVEDLRLVHCIGLVGLHISALIKLKRVEVHECHGLKLVEIELPNLTSFWYCGKKSWECKINLAGCESLRYLTLQDSNMTDELFHEQISKFPDLEKLVLKECNILESITILSKKLHGLSIIRCKKLEEAIIDTPNLFSLEYTGDKFPFSSLNITSLLDVKFHFESLRKRKPLLLLELRIFIGKFNKDEAWKLVVSSKKDVIVHEELGEIQFPPSNNFKVELTKSSANLKDIVDNLLRMSHPKTLSFMSSPSSEFLKFLLEKLVNRELNPSCCTYYMNKCWLHYLEDVGIEMVAGAENLEIPTCIPRSLSSQTAFQATFNLKWRPARSV